MTLKELHDYFVEQIDTKYPEFKKERDWLGNILYHSENYRNGMQSFLSLYKGFLGSRKRTWESFSVTRGGLKLEIKIDKLFDFEYFVEKGEDIPKKYEVLVNYETVDHIALDSLEEIKERLWGMIVGMIEQD